MSFHRGFEGTVNVIVKVDPFQIYSRIYQRQFNGAALLRI
jgi:hypothetical protein